MEHLENDMDDLFQKAGELYPLKTSETDWKTVLGKLNEEGFGTQAVPGLTAKRNRNRRRWLFLLFLIPLGLGSVGYFSNSKMHRDPNSPLTNNNNNTKKSSDVVVVKPAIENETANQKLDKQMAVNKIKLQKESINRKMVKSSGNTIAGNNQRIVVKRSVSGNSRNLLADNVRRNRNESYALRSNTSVVESEIIYDNLALSTSSENSQTILKKTIAEKPLSLSVPGLTETISVEGKPLPSTAPRTFSDMPPVTNSKKQNNNSSAKGFYVAFIGGPDLSTVKFQSVKQMGFSLGGLVGYRINKRFAVETGLMWDKKYYYSDGEYFNKSETTIPASVNILNVNGSCNMFEIPLNIRYDFATTISHGFFVKAGFSSYLMKKENYSMSLEHPGYPIHDSAYSYNNSSKNIFSIFQLSGGYEHAIGGNTEIWVEPYLKIPLQGVGIGSMPISSAGFYIGISYSFR
jgi:Outer membrane protein beta-barrel domain